MKKIICFLILSAMTIASVMAHWITLFVEVPVATFNPVKTVNDLLRKEHLEG